MLAVEVSSKNIISCIANVTHAVLQLLETMDSFDQNLPWWHEYTAHTQDLSSEFDAVLNTNREQPLAEVKLDITQIWLGQSTVTAIFGTSSRLQILSKIFDKKMDDILCTF